VCTANKEPAGYTHIHTLTHLKDQLQLSLPVMLVSLLPTAALSRPPMRVMSLDRGPIGLRKPKNDGRTSSVTLVRSDGRMDRMRRTSLKARI